MCLTCAFVLQLLPVGAILACMGITAELLRDTRAFVLSRTQQELADTLGVSLRTIVNWESKGVPERNEYRVRRVIGDALDQWQAHLNDYAQDSEEWKRRVEEGSYDPSDEQLTQDAEFRRNSEVMAFHRQLNQAAEMEHRLNAASDEDLVKELMRRLKQRNVSDADYTLAASDADIDSEIEAQQEEP